jgi:hypothetical protein
MAEVLFCSREPSIKRDKKYFDNEKLPKNGS